MEKILNARLKDIPTVALGVTADFEKDWILAARLVDQMKEKALRELKTKLHEKIAVLSLEDIEFKIVEPPLSNR